MPRRTGREALHERVRESLKSKQEHNRALAKANELRYSERPTMTQPDEENYDYGPEHTPVADFKLTQEIGACVFEANALKLEIQDLKDNLKEKETELSGLVDKRIPDLMVRAGLEMVKTPDGLYVELEKKTFASIPSPTGIAKERDPEKRSEMIQRREAAIKWLEENQHTDLVKREFVVQFQKGDEAWANKFRADLAKRRKPLHVIEGEDVNHMSLSALVRQLREQGAVFPEKVFGVYEKATVKISK